MRNTAGFVLFIKVSGSTIHGINKQNTPISSGLIDAVKMSLIVDEDSSSKSSCDLDLLNEV